MLVRLAPQGNDKRHVHDLRGTRPSTCWTVPAESVSLQLGPFFDYAAAMVLLCFVQAELFTILRPLHCCGPWSCN